MLLCKVVVKMLIRRKLLRFCCWPLRSNILTMIGSMALSKAVQTMSVWTWKSLTFMTSGLYGPFRPFNLKNSIIQCLNLRDNCCSCFSRVKSLNSERKSWEKVADFVDFNLFKSFAANFDIFMSERKIFV